MVFPVAFDRVINHMGGKGHMIHLVISWWASRRFLRSKFVLTGVSNSF